MNTLEEAWNIIKETDLLIKELSKQAALSRQEMDRRSQETDRKFQETRLLIHESLADIQEVRLSIKELSQEMKSNSQALDLKFQETDRKFQETRQLINSVNGKLGQLGNRLGEFVEGLIKPSVVRSVELPSTKSYAISKPTTPS